MRLEAIRQNCFLRLHRQNWKKRYLILIGIAETYHRMNFYFGFQKNSKVEDPTVNKGGQSLSRVGMSLALTMPVEKVR